MAAAAAARTAALRRLSTRAACFTPSPATSRSFSHQNGLLTFSDTAKAILNHLRDSGIDILPGLSEPELVKIEAELKLNLPPDLRALLSLGLPSTPGFPNWRNLINLRQLINRPVIAIKTLIARDTFWPRSLGPCPADPVMALRHAGPTLLRAPPLVPLFDRCYLPCAPCLAGNPVFVIDNCQVICCAADMAEFFLSPRRIPVRVPRRIEMWSEVVGCRRGSFSGEEFVEIRPGRVPEWARRFLDRVGAALREGGWGDVEVEEMVESPAAADAGEDGTCLAEIVVEGLLVKADRCSNSLRRAGWSDKDIADIISFDFRFL